MDSVPGALCDRRVSTELNKAMQSPAAEWEGQVGSEEVSLKPRRWLAEVVQKRTRWVPSVLWAWDLLEWLLDRGG